MYIDFCVIVIQSINIGEQERQCMMFTTTTQVKYLKGLRFQLSFAYTRYGKMKNLTSMKI